MNGAVYRSLLATRREQLVQRTQQQRVQLADSLEPLAHATLRVDRGLALWRALRERPGLALLSVLAPAALLALWKPRALLRSLAAGLALWRAGRSVQRAWNAPRTSRSEETNR